MGFCINDEGYRALSCQGTGTGANCGNGTERESHSDSTPTVPSHSSSIPVRKYIAAH